MRLKGSMKGAGQVGSLLISLLLVGMVIYGMALYIGALATSYDIDDSPMDSVLANSTAIYTNVEEIGNSTQAVQENPDAQVGYEGMMDAVGMVWNVANFVPNFLYSLLEMTGDMFGLSWAVPYLTAILLLVIAFAVLNWLRGGGANL